MAQKTFTEAPLFCGITQDIAPSNVVSTSVYSWNTIAERFSREFSTSRTFHLNFFRHGQSISNKNKLITGKMDVPLTKIGKNQASALSNLIKNAKIDIVICSSLQRSQETMRIALRHRLEEITHSYIDSRLDERSLGSLEGQEAVYIPEFANGNLDYAPEGGETYRQLAQRCVSFLIDLSLAVRNLERDDDVNIFIFSHMGPMRVFESIFGKIASSKEMMGMDFHNIEARHYLSTNADLPTFYLR